MREDKRESFNVKQGDIVKIPSGITVYTVNRNKNQKFVMIDFLLPVSNPGELEVYIYIYINSFSLLKFERVLLVKVCVSLIC